MKSTAERLSDVYCRPKTEDDKLFPYISTQGHYGVYLDNEYGCLCFDEGEWMYLHGTEIPVQHFLDLRNDLIVSWRALLDGFQIHSATHEINDGFTEFKFNINETYVLIKFPYDNSKPSVSLFKDEIEIPMEGCKTYTDLITLIRLIGLN
jgi:hypothetical protein